MSHSYGEVYCKLWNKIPLNIPNNNYCRGVSHKPPFEGLPSECDGGVAIVRHGKSLSDTHETRLSTQDISTSFLVYFLFIIVIIIVDL